MTEVIKSCNPKLVSRMAFQSTNEHPISALLKSPEDNILNFKTSHSRLQSSRIVASHSQKQNIFQVLIIYAQNRLSGQNFLDIFSKIYEKKFLLKVCRSILEKMSKKFCLESRCTRCQAYMTRALILLVESHSTILIANFNDPNMINQTYT